MTPTHRFCASRTLVRCAPQSATHRCQVGRRPTDLRPGKRNLALNLLWPVPAGKQRMHLVELFGGEVLAHGLSEPDTAKTLQVADA